MADPQYGPEHQARRRAWQQHLDTVGPVVCRKEGCGRLVYADPAMNYDGKGWHLGHGRAVHHSGDGADSAPEHDTCNTSDGYAISQSSPLLLREW